jgi:putative membrane protein
MNLLLRVIIQIFANSAAILAADWLVPGFVFRGDWQDLFLAGAILGIVNSLLRPIVKLLTLPVIILTLGLFTIIINIAMLFLAASFIPGLIIIGFWAGFWAVIIISIVNGIITKTFKPKEEN